MNTIVVPLTLAVAVACYPLAAITTSRKYRRWPLHRYVCWIAGVLCAAAAVYGPIAERAHHDFAIHMVGHLLLGMLAPLLIALSAPVTLLLRTLWVPWSRFVSQLLRSRLLSTVSDPLFAAVLNIGGLWVLYTTNLYSLMQHSPTIHTLVHLHVFLAGYVFTVSIIPVDPAPRRFGYLYRSIILIVALAFHGILSKLIYFSPPIGIPREQAEIGGMIMYYGGDAIDVIIITVLGFQWLRSNRVYLPGYIAPPK